MGSETRPTISIICDDANTTTALRRMDAFGFPVHASVIVTRNPRFRSVSAFVDSHRDMLQKFDPGLHLDLFEGVTPKDKMHISGRNGLLHQVLHTVESGSSQKRRRKQSAQKVLDALQVQIWQLMDLQIMRFMDLFDRIPSYMTYHFGLHALNTPHALFQQIARDWNIPSRHATQYTKLRDPLSLVLYDSLNTSGVTVHNVHRVLDKIEQSRAPAELMVHFGEKAYGRAQYRAMTDSSVKQRLCSFDVVMPSEAVQRLKVMAPK